jgi:hypothetical protein
LPINHTKILFLHFLIIVLTMAIMIYFGINQKGFDYNNSISWLQNEGGLYFSTSSFAYTEKFFPREPIGFNGLSINLTLKPDFFDFPRFSVILQIYNKADDSQITIGQWDKSLVVLNSNDYSNIRRKPKIYIPMADNGQKREISIISDKTGTSVFIEGAGSCIEYLRGFYRSASYWKKNRFIRELRHIINNGSIPVCKVPPH